MRLTKQFTAALGRDVYLRPGTSDQQTWNDTFGGAGGYHLPPQDMPTPASVLDLGANIGLTAAHYKALWPAAKVVGVEPAPDNQHMFRLNAPGAFLRTLAVSTHDGSAELVTEGLQPEAYRLSAGGTTRVHCVSLSGMIGYDFGDSCDFVKMDVEGTEWDLFAVGDMWADRVKHMLVELHPWGLLPDDTSTLVAAAIGSFVELGFNARHHPPHPRAVYAWR